MIDRNLRPFELAQELILVIAGYAKCITSSYPALPQSESVENAIAAIDQIAPKDDLAVFGIGMVDSVI